MPSYKFLVYIKTLTFQCNCSCPLLNDLIWNYKIYDLITLVVMLVLLLAWKWSFQQSVDVFVKPVLIITYVYKYEGVYLCKCVLFCLFVCVCVHTCTYIESVWMLVGYIIQGKVKKWDKLEKLFNDNHFTLVC